VRTALKMLRDRSRDLVRNNPFATAGLDLMVSYQVGTGIMPRSATRDDALDSEVDALWSSWAAGADLSGRTDIYGLQALMARARGESGEVLAQLIPLTAQEARSRRLPVPLAIQVIEADHLDETFDGGMRGQSPMIRQGIELDRAQRPVAYHVHLQHPAETDGLLGPASALQRERIPAERMLHLFRQDRPGQLRGVPDLAPVMTRLRSLDELEDAALEQAKVQACLAALIVSQAPAAAGPLEGTGAADEEAAEAGQKTLYPGMMERLLPGEDVKFLTPSGTGSFDGLARHQLHAIATGWGLTYDLLTGDLSGANYSSLRAGRLAFKRRLERLQWHVLIPGMCQRIWDAWIDAAIRAGVLAPREGGYPVAWSPPVFEMVDPLKDAMAVKEQMRLGLLTWGQAVGQMGWEPRRQAEEIAEWNAAHDDRGLILDGDPRRTGGSGGAQDTRVNSAIEIAATGAATDAAAPAEDVVPVVVENRLELSGDVAAGIMRMLEPTLNIAVEVAGGARQAAEVAARASETAERTTREAAQALSGQADRVSEAIGIAVTAAAAAGDAARTAADAVRQARKPRHLEVVRDAQGRITGTKEAD
jgi:lambda family phage portal protein